MSEAYKSDAYDEFLSGLDRDEVLVLAIAAVRELNKRDGAMPCLIIPTPEKQPISRCKRDHEDPQDQTSVWSIQSTSAHVSQAKFYGYTMVEGLHVDLCPHIQKGRH